MKIPNGRLTDIMKIEKINNKYKYLCCTAKIKLIKSKNYNIDRTCVFREQKMLKLKIQDGRHINSMKNLKTIYVKGI